MTERVDRHWQRKGLEAYASPAILGTLGHYGVSVDEAGFLALAAQDFPLSIAESWHQRWTGTGQFSRFPAAAAEELWRRLCAPRVAPTDVALAAVKLVGSLGDALAGKPDDGTLETRFAVVEAYLPAMPSTEPLRARFLGELGAALAPWMESIDPLAERLARKPLPGLADRFATLEEALFPVRVGTAKALVQAARGDVDGAAAVLDTLAADANRSGPAQLAVLDAYLDLARVEPARALALAVLDRAEAAKDVELAAGAVERLTRLLQLDPRREDRQALRARVDALARALQPG
jgi:hypothetical protein